MLCTVLDPRRWKAVRTVSVPLYGTEVYYDTAVLLSVPVAGCTDSSSSALAQHNCCVLKLVVDKVLLRSLKENTCNKQRLYVCIHT